MLGPRYPFAGKSDLTLDLQAKGKDLTTIRQSLQGNATLDVLDLFVDGLKLDTYLDEQLTPKAPAPQSFEQLIGKLRGVIPPLITYICNYGRIKAHWISVVLLLNPSRI